MIRLLTLSVQIGIMVFLTISCGKKNDRPYIDKLLIGNWTLNSIENPKTNKLIYYPDTFPSKEIVRFMDYDTVLYFNGICNDAMAYYTISNSSLLIHSIGTTAKFCKNQIWEDYLYYGLLQAKEYHVDSNQLTIYGRDTINLHFNKNL